MKKSLSNNQLVSSKSVSHSRLSISNGSRPQTGSKPIDDSIEQIVQDPLRCGFLLAFCEKNYCSENIRFVMEVDKFRDHFASDGIPWHKQSTSVYNAEEESIMVRGEKRNMFVVESEFNELLKEEHFLPESLWPSNKSKLALVENIIRNIWNTYLSTSAPHQICMPSHILLKTIQRIKLIDLYGKEIFNEALVDPIKTLRRDIHNRFISSDYFHQMKIRLSEIEVLPSASTLILSPPPHTINHKYSRQELKSGKVKFSLNEFLEDKALYTEFLKYLCKIVSSENLRCLRAIEMFQNEFNLETTNNQLNHMKSTELAWTIYKYFVAPGSAYEISTSQRIRKEVMRTLATPSYDMFVEVYQSALSSLRVHFASYAKTHEYNQLAEYILTKQESKSMRSIESSSPLNCFGLMI
eukprot:gene4350-6154_t